eukprot:scaffold599_cov180-Amphora_coffeaeformis.AAC.4
MNASWNDSSLPSTVYVNTNSSNNESHSHTTELGRVSPSLRLTARPHDAITNAVVLDNISSDTTATKKQQQQQQQQQSQQRLPPKKRKVHVKHQWTTMPPATMLRRQVASCWPVGTFRPTSEVPAPTSGSPYYVERYGETARWIYPQGPQTMRQQKQQKSEDVHLEQHTLSESHIAANTNPHHPTNNINQPGTTMMTTSTTTKTRRVSLPVGQSFPMSYNGEDVGSIATDRAIAPQDDRPPSLVARQVYPVPLQVMQVEFPRSLRHMYPRFLSKTTTVTRHRDRPILPTRKVSLTHHLPAEDTGATDMMQHRMMHQSAPNLTYYHDYHPYAQQHDPIETQEQDQQQDDVLPIVVHPVTPPRHKITSWKQAQSPTTVAHHETHDDTADAQDYYYSCHHHPHYHSAPDLKYYHKDDTTTVHPLNETHHPGRRSAAFAPE